MCFSAEPVWFMPLLAVNIAADQEAVKTLFFQSKLISSFMQTLDQPDEYL